MEGLLSISTLLHGISFSSLFASFPRIAFNPFAKIWHFEQHFLISPIFLYQNDYNEI